jgi:uncharacterized membrane protein YcaP (DUF421 family)
VKEETVGTVLSWYGINANMLHLEHVSVVEKMLRPLIVYLALVAGLRVAGKRELAQMNPLDLIVLLTLSNTVQNAIIGDDVSISGGLIGAATLLAVNYILIRLTYQSPAVDRVVNGDPVPLIEHGTIRRDHLKQLLISEPELRAVCRRQGVRHLEEVETATLETSGTISVFGRQPTPEEIYFHKLDERLARIEAALTARN